MNHVQIPLPLLMFGLGLGAVRFAHAMRDEIGIVRWFVNGAAVACCVVAALIYHTVPPCAAMVGVPPSEIEAFRLRFEEALRIADISITKASLWLYGKEDHGRLRRELNGEGGGLSAVRIERLPTHFQVIWLESEARAHRIRLAAEDTLDRLARVLALAPKPKPASMQETTVCATQAS